MPFFLIGLGVVMVAAALQNRQGDLAALWVSELSGQGSFLNVAFVILLLGALGAITGLRPLAIAFMGLVLLVMVLSNSGTTETTNILSRLRRQLLGG